MNEFLNRIKSPIVLSGIVGGLVEIALIWGITESGIEPFKITALILIGLYQKFFVSTNNPTSKDTY